MVINVRKNVNVSLYTSLYSRQDESPIAKAISKRDQDRHLKNESNYYVIQLILLYFIHILTSCKALRARNIIKHLCQLSPNLGRLLYIYMYIITIE